MEINIHVMILVLQPPTYSHRKLSAEVELKTVAVLLKRLGEIRLTSEFTVGRVLNVGINCANTEKLQVYHQHIGIKLM